MKCSGPGRITLSCQHHSSCRKPLACQGLSAGVWVWGSRRAAVAGAPAYLWVVKTGTTTRTSKVSLESALTVVDETEVTRKRHGRARVTNHADLLPGIKGTSSAARRFRDLVNAFVADSGGLDN